MGTYPSTSELAAFRGGIPGPHHTLVASPDHGGAWDYELKNGIGWRRSVEDPLHYGIKAEDIEYIEYRAEAAAMRERGMERLRETMGAGDLMDLVSTFEPWYVPTPAPAGYWDDEQPRSPLPIAYRNPISAA